MKFVKNLKASHDAAAEFMIKGIKKRCEKHGYKTSYWHALYWLWSGFILEAFALNFISALNPSSVHRSVVIKTCIIGFLIIWEAVISYLYIWREYAYYPDNGKILAKLFVILYPLFFLATIKYGWSGHFPYGAFIDGLIAMEIIFLSSRINK